ncbi:MAG: hypothetical protein WA888_15740 [Burkholderiaceae bacterium]
MQNPTRFQLTELEAGVGAADAPQLMQIRQQFPRPVEADVAAAVHRELKPLINASLMGKRIAITGSSRGIANLAVVIRECVAALRLVGAEPFVVPGMGSHGGATASGQEGVLRDTNAITTESVGCPIVSSMDVVQVGTTATGFPVYQDKLCHEADGVLVVNRVKPHTGFTERVESGLCKMLVIGLGKQKGASKIHQQALRVPMGQLILDASRIIVESDRPRLIGGLALVENAFKETAVVKGVSMANHQQMVDSEAALLETAYELLPRLPFDDLDALIVDEIGKNISGSGMDSNVIAKKEGLTKPRIGAIYVRGLTPETHGNATGIGFADLMPRALVEQIDLNSTYMNAFTAKRPVVGKLPMVMESELQALQVLMNFRQHEDPQSLRLVWIKSTAKLSEMWVSGAFAQEVADNPRLQIISPAQPMRFCGSGNLQPPSAPPVPSGH